MSIEKESNAKVVINKGCFKNQESKWKGNLCYRILRYVIEMWIASFCTNEILNIFSLKLGNFLSYIEQLEP